MFEKNLSFLPLFDTYGKLLTDTQQKMFELYYGDDLSLAEIAAELGISRQGVRDMIKKTEEELFFYEQKLGLAKKLKHAESQLEAITKKALQMSLPDEFIGELEILTRIIEE